MTGGRKREDKVQHLYHTYFISTGESETKLFTTLHIKNVSLIYDDGPYECFVPGGRRVQFYITVISGKRSEL